MYYAFKRVEEYWDFVFQVRHGDGAKNTRIDIDIVEPDSQIADMRWTAVCKYCGMQSLAWRRIDNTSSLWESLEIQHTRDRCEKNK